MKDILNFMSNHVILTIFIIYITCECIASIFRSIFRRQVIVSSCNCKDKDCSNKKGDE
jgi:hypothetical protein